MKSILTFQKITIMILWVAFLIGCSETEELPTPESVLGVGKIAFSSDRDRGGGNYNVYIMDEYGHITRITGTEYEGDSNLYPALSFDGSKISFVKSMYIGFGYIGHDSLLYMANSDGTQLVLIRKVGYQHGAVKMIKHPALSPDGRKLVYTYIDGNYHGDYPGEEYGDIYLVDSDGANAPGILLAKGSTPAWSPDGRKIAYSSSEERPRPYSPLWIGEICVINSDGTGPIQHLGVKGVEPSWSPDGEKIVFSTDWIWGSICVINSDGTGGVTTLGRGNDPVWSPDGKKIAFWSSDGDNEIFIMDSDGTNIINLTDNQADDYMPSWAWSVPEKSGVVGVYPNPGG